MAEIKLKPHHVFSYLAHVIAEEQGAEIFSLSDEAYLEMLRQERGFIPPREAGYLHTFREIYQKDLEFEYVSDAPDSVCGGCPSYEACKTPGTEAFDESRKADAGDLPSLVGLEFGKTYKTDDLRRTVMPAVQERLSLHSRLE